MDQIGLLTKAIRVPINNYERDVFSNFCQNIGKRQMMMAQVMIFPLIEDQKLLHHCAKPVGTLFAYNGGKMIFTVEIPEYCIGVN